MSLRQIIRTRGPFLNVEAAIPLLYLALWNQFGNTRPEYRRLSRLSAK
jgi:hypothetical protein